MKISSHNKFYRIQLKQLFFDPSRIESQFRKKKNPVRNSIERIITLVKFKERLAGLSSLAVEWQ